MERQAHFVTKHLVANMASRAVNTRGPCHVVVYVMESTFGVVWSGISELRPEMNVKGGAICRSVGSGKSRQRGKKKAFIQRLALSLEQVGGSGAAHGGDRIREESVSER